MLEFDPTSRGLMQRMSALEGYPNEKLVGTDAFDYTHADEHVKNALSKLAAKEEAAKKSNGAASEAGGDDATNGDDENEEKKRNERNNKVKVGTLSKSEWDAVTLYMVFAFQKISEPS